VNDSNTGILTIAGTLNGKPLTVTMRRINRSELPLVNRGFHWISESTFIH
jgi:hypothetical protein